MDANVGTLLVLSVQRQGGAIGSSGDGSGWGEAGIILVVVWRQAGEMGWTEEPTLAGVCLFVIGLEKNVKTNQ